MHRILAPTLLIPGLIWPLQALRDITHGLPTPSLCRLLGLGTLRPQAAADVEDKLAALCGIVPPLPAAALRRTGFGVGSGDADWLCLDPVQLNFVDRRLLLGDPTHLKLSQAEADALASAVAPYLTNLGTLEPTRPDAWHLRLHAGARTPDMPPLPRAIGARADLGLGNLDQAWRQALNEIQMLLHTHPVNLAREAAGLPRVNSLWPWGGGSLPTTTRSAFDLWLTDSAVLAGLARHLGARAEAVPARWPAALDSHTPLIVLDALAAPAATGDAMAWRAALHQLESEWFAPLLAQVLAGTVGPLHLHFPGARNGHALEIGQRARWAFWRRPGALTALAET